MTRQETAPQNLEGNMYRNTKDIQTPEVFLLNYHKLPSGSLT